MRRIALLLLESAFLVALLEVGLRAVVAPQVDVPHLRVYPEGFYTWYPGARFTYHNLPGVEPESAAVRINALGLRGSEIPSPKPAGERRVLVVGDSFTAAVQLPEDRIFTTLLQRELEEARPHDAYRVVNAGVNGAGTAHELLYFLRQGAALGPDLVVLQYAFNDIDDTRSHGGFRLTENGVELRGDLQNPPWWRGPLLALRDAVGNRSLAFYLLYRMLLGAHPRPAGAAEVPPQASGASTDAEVALVARLTARLVTAANAVGARVIVLTIPSPLTTGRDAYPQVVAAFRSLLDGTANRLIVADPWLREAQQRGEAVYLAHDGHLSEVGHRVIAHALARSILLGEEPHS